MCFTRSISHPVSLQVAYTNRNGARSTRAIKNSYSSFHSYFSFCYLFIYGAVSVLFSSSPCPFSLSMIPYICEHSNHLWFVCIRIDNILGHMINMYVCMQSYLMSASAHATNTQSFVGCFHFVYGFCCGFCHRFQIDHIFISYLGKRKQIHVFPDWNYAFCSTLSLMVGNVPINNDLQLVTDKNQLNSIFGPHEAIFIDSR